MNVAASYGNVSDIEVLWTLVALGGAAFSLYNVRDAARDYRATAHIKNGRRWIAASQVRVEVARLAIQLIFLAIGVLAMFLPSPPDAVLSTLQVVTGAVFRWGLIVSGLLLLYQSVQNYTLRRILRDEIPKH